MTRFIALGLMVALAGLTGCGGGIPTYPVTGTVTDASGSPIEGAAVTFHPSSGDGALAVGVTDASGVYTLKTGSDDGARAGSYTVSLAKYEAPPEVYTGEEDPNADPDDITNEYPDDYDENKANAQANEASANKLAPELADPKKSGLKADVAEEDNTIDFQLPQ